MVVKSCLVIWEISMVIIVVGTVLVMVFVASAVVVGVNILPTNCVKQNVITCVKNAGSMKVGAKTTIRMVLSSSTWSALTKRS